MKKKIKSDIKEWLHITSQCIGILLLILLVILGVWYDITKEIAFWELVQK